jgi:hypothetical protein
VAEAGPAGDLALGQAEELDVVTEYPSISDLHNASRSPGNGPVRMERRANISEVCPTSDLNSYRAVDIS